MDDIWSLEAKIKAEIENFSLNYIFLQSSPGSESVQRLCNAFDPILTPESR